MKFSLQNLYFIVSSLTSNRQMSVRRLIKICYLIDWHMSFRLHQESHGTWIYGLCGPTESTIERAINVDNEWFCLKEVDNHYGGLKKIVICKEHELHEGSIDNALKVALENTKHVLFDIRWERLSLIVSSTYPLSKTNPGSIIDLNGSAPEYNEILKKRHLGGR